MQKEMADHLSQATDRFRARGMNTGEAMLAARREFGVVSVIQEDARDARGGQWIASVMGDLRHAVRHFARSPLMAATNAISGISLVGSLVAAGGPYSSTSHILGMIAVCAASINVVGGFMITDRMLRMFRRKPVTKPKEEKS